MEVWAKAPGRVNIIGEHTDYNQGYVLPMAINMGISLTAKRRSDSLVKVYARNFKEEATFNLSTLVPGKGQNWWDYPAGVCWILQEEGYKLAGADISFEGDIPIGAGLSSSAALEVASMAAFCALNRIDLDLKEQALLAQRAENEYVGVRCGIMDQFASALSKQAHALFIDCRSLEYEHVPLSLGAYHFVIIDSGIKRSLAGSAYNRRREECEQALNLINRKTNSSRQSLREVDPDELEEARSYLPRKLFNRAFFVISENERVLRAVRSFKQGDLLTAGILMNASHEGLRSLFEVSCRELDLIAIAAQKARGVLGARMTGAGFGGCAVALVRKDCTEALTELILKETAKLPGLKPAFYPTGPAGGLEVSEV